MLYLSFQNEMYFNLILSPLMKLPGSWNGAEFCLEPPFLYNVDYSNFPQQIGQVICTLGDFSYKISKHDLLILYMNFWIVVVSSFSN